MKLQWNITSHQSEKPSSKNLWAINAREGMERRETLSTLGTTNGEIGMEDALKN